MTKKRSSTIDRVLEAMRSKEWNQSELAKRMGVGPADITNWKARGMPADKLQDASDALGCSVDWLLGKADNPKSNGSVAYWPFGQDVFDDFKDLEEDQQLDIGGMVEDQVRRFTAKNGPRRRRKSAEY